MYATSAQTEYLRICSTVFFRKFNHTQAYARALPTVSGQTPPHPNRCPQTDATTLHGVQNELPTHAVTSSILNQFPHRLNVCLCRKKCILSRCDLDPLTSDLEDLISDAHSHDEHLYQVSLKSLH